MDSKSSKKTHSRKQCFVPGCKTGTRKSKFKYSLFKAPANELLRVQWSTIIRRIDKELKENCAVCELHFHSKYIERYCRNSVYGPTFRRFRPRLKSGAIPTMFPKRKRLKPKSIPKTRSNVNRHTPITHRYETRLKSLEQASKIKESCNVKVIMEAPSCSAEVVIEEPSCRAEVAINELLCGAKSSNIEIS